MPSGTSARRWNSRDGTGGPTSRWAASAISPSQSDGSLSPRCARPRCRPSRSWRSRDGCPSRSPRWCWRRWAGSTSCRAGSTRRRRGWIARNRRLRPNAEPAKEMLVRHSRGLQRLGQGRLAEAKVLVRRDATASVAPGLARSLAIWARGCLAQVLIETGRPSGSSGRARHRVRRRARVCRHASRVRRDPSRRAGSSRGGR